MMLPASTPPWPYKVDAGVVLLLAALFLASILAHRYWRAKIRLEDDLEARDQDALRSFERYRLAFRASTAPAAFADRVTGLVLEASPGWLRAGLPEPGREVFLGDPALEAAWRAIPAPGPDHVPAPPAALSIGGRAFTGTCLGGPSLGVVLLVPTEG